MIGFIGFENKQDYDFCYDPNYMDKQKASSDESGTVLIKAVDKGIDGCSSSKPCGHGEGDCDKDEDCCGTLKCF